MFATAFGQQKKKGLIGYKSEEWNQGEALARILGGLLKEKYARHQKEYEKMAGERRQTTEQSLRARFPHAREVKLRVIEHKDHDWMAVDADLFSLLAAKEIST